MLHSSIFDRAYTIFSLEGCAEVALIVVAQFCADVVESGIHYRSSDRVASLNAMVIAKHQAVHLYDLVFHLSVLYNLTFYHLAPIALIHLYYCCKFNHILGFKYFYSTKKKSISSKNFFLFPHIKMSCSTNVYLCIR